MHISYSNSRRHTDPQPLFAAMLTVRELRLVLTVQGSGTSMKPLISGSIAVRIRHVYPFPVGLRQEAS